MEEDGQNARVLRHLKKFGSITSLQAFQLYGITRLSGRIYDLRKCGVKIKDCFCEDVNRYGKTVRFKKYFDCLDTRKTVTLITEDEQPVLIQNGLE